MLRRVPIATFRSLFFFTILLAFLSVVDYITGQLERYFTTKLLKVAVTRGMRHWDLRSCDFGELELGGLR